MHSTFPDPKSKTYIHPRIRLLKDTKKVNDNLERPINAERRWNRFYGCKAWHNLRDSKLLDQPLCECCLSQGRIREADCVHHRIVFGSAPTDDMRWQYFLDYDNLVSLCTECHRMIHKQMPKKWIERLD